MFEVMLEPFGFDFMLRAMYGGVLVAVMCAIVGVLVIQRGMAFAGDGLAHATFGGIGIAIFLGLSPDIAIWTALPFTMIVSLGITWLRRRGNLRGDTAIAVFLPITLALGLVFLARRPPGAPPLDIEAMMFGSILAVSSTDLMVISVTSLFVITILAFYGTRIAYAGFDEDLAELSGVRTAYADYILAVLTAILVVTAVKAVGVTMVSAFLVIPPVTSLLVARRLGLALAVAAGLGGCGALIGLIAAYFANLPGGAAVVLTLGLLSGLTVKLRRLS